MSDSTWKFVTKKNPFDASDDGTVIHHVALFQDGVPMFPMADAPRLRKPTPEEEFWGILIPPKGEWFRFCDELRARGRQHLREVREELRAVLKDPAQALGGEYPATKENIESLLEVNHRPVAVRMVLSEPEFLGAFTNPRQIHLMEGH